MRLLDEQAIAELLGLSHSHIRQHVVTTPKFPRPLEIPGRGRRPVRRWIADEVEEYLVQLRRQR